MAVLTLLAIFDCKS